MDLLDDLSLQDCENMASGSPALPRNKFEKYLSQLDAEWRLSEDGKSINRVFKFKNYYQTMAFANVAAMIAHQQDHHPDMTISYNHCHITYSTHSVDGLSINDFICAAKTDKTLKL